MSEARTLRPAEAACRLGVRTLVVIEAMHEERIARVRLPDGTLGIPEDALAGFDVPPRRADPATSEGTRRRKRRELTPISSRTPQAGARSRTACRMS